MTVHDGKVTINIQCITPHISPWQHSVPTEQRVLPIPTATPAACLPPPLRPQCLCGLTWPAASGTTRLHGALSFCSPPPAAVSKGSVGARISAVSHHAQLAPSGPCSAGHYQFCPHLNFRPFLHQRNSSACWNTPGKKLPDKNLSHRPISVTRPKTSLYVRVLAAPPLSLFFLCKLFQRTQKRHVLHILAFA